MQNSTSSYRNNSSVPSKQITNSITKKVGATTYLIRIHFPETERESMSEKLLRIITNDAEKAVL